MSPALTLGPSRIKRSKKLLSAIAESHIGLYGDTTKSFLHDDLLLRWTVKARKIYLFPTQTH